MGREIIGIGGRLGSGKTVLANICEKHGYIKYRFAEPLKCLVADLINVKREDIDGLKTANNSYVFKDIDCMFVSEQTDINVQDVKTILLNREFKNTRELLQVIGTDLIRKHNPNWHRDKTFEYINSEENKDKNFVIDDLRFPNEKDAIENNGGVCWYVVRPIFDNISNHESEISLRWQQFDNIIVNDSTLEYLTFNWESMIENGHLNAIEKRNRVYDKAIGSYDGSNDLVKSIISCEEKFTLLDYLFISKYEFTYTGTYFNLNEERKPNIIEIKNGKYVKIMSDVVDGDSLYITNPLMMEDLKLYMQ